MAKLYGKGGKLALESEDQHRMRFQVELEFVQCLANPNYLHFIAQRGFFKDSAFINYLKYLLYWKEPEYARYLKYPMCLYFLDLLQYEHFRREIVNAQCCKFIDDQAILLWQHYTRRRTKLFSMHNGVIQMEPQQNGSVSGAGGGGSGGGTVGAGNTGSGVGSIGGGGGGSGGVSGGGISNSGAGCSQQNGNGQKL